MTCDAEAAAQIRSAKRVLVVLEYVNQAGPTSVSAIARAVGLPRATAGRIVATLKSLGYVDDDTATQGVRAARRVLNLAKGFQGDLERMSAIRAALSELTRKIKWPLTFARPCGAHVEVAATTAGESPLAIERHQVGCRLPVHDTASGCIILAASSPAVREHVYELLQQDGAAKPTLISDLQARVRRAETQGYAWHRSGGQCEAVMAIPITTGEPDAVGALAIRYIHSAMTPEEVARNLLPQVREAGAAVERAWRM